MIDEIWPTMRGIKPFRGLVEKDDLGLQHHGPRDGQHLLLAARQRASRLVAPLREHGKEP